MKKIIFSAFWLIVGIANAQQIKVTLSFTISGEVFTPMTVSVMDFKKWKEVAGDMVITNHLGEKKSEAKGLKGILLKEILQTVEIKSESLPAPTLRQTGPKGLR